MNHLDLFSGIGGFALALENVGFKTVGFCEVDPYCRLLLQKHWKGVTIHNDIKKLEAKDIKEPIDILTGGFPCQPYSVAGKQKGTDDNRYLWPDMFRVIKEVKPTFIIAENVRGIVNIQDGLVFETVCSDLESEGFEIQPFIIPAAGVGAPHKRERVWIVGYSKHNGSLTSKIRRGNEEANAGTQKGTDKTIESERTSRSSNDETYGELQTHIATGEQAQRKRMQMKIDKKMPISLNDQVAHPNIMWPTPTATERSGINPKTGKGAGLNKTVQMWPTPREFMYKDSKIDRGKSNLGEKVGGSLNPTWVEWLMGYPGGYTDLKDWETLSSRKSQKK